jgi:hypothetical protein
MTVAMKLALLAGAAMFSACGKVTTSGAPADASPVDTGAGSDSGPPAGVHHTYVVNHVGFVPDSGHTATDYGLDLGSPTGPALDGKVDNQLGAFFAEVDEILAGPPVLSVQVDENNAITIGKTILLVDMQAPDLINAQAATFALKLGANPVPAACTNPFDPTTCGQHLKGDASFSIADNSPTLPPLTGPITNGTFTSGAGDATLALALINTTTPPAVLHLAHARARITSMSADGIMTANIGGLITQAELAEKIIPQIHESINEHLAAAHCSTSGPPSCGCAPAMVGGQLLFVMDGDTGVPADCTISDQEILAYQPFAALIHNDACSQAVCTTPDSLSLGIQISAVKATFPTH